MTRRQAKRSCRRETMTAWKAMSLNTEIHMQESLHEVFQFKLDTAFARVMRHKIKLDERYSETASEIFGESLEAYGVVEEQLLRWAVDLQRLYEVREVMEYSRLQTDTVHRAA